MLQHYHSINAYFKFLIQSVNQHGVHSPFVYNLVTQCFYNKTKHDAYQKIKDYKNDLLKNKQVITVTDYGAGSKVFNDSKRAVNKIATNAGIGLKRAFLLHRLAHYLQCTTALELGTSLGIGTCAIASADSIKELTTIEGCPETAKFAQNQLKQYQLTNVKVLNTTFEKALKQLENRPFDLIYLDGHHSLEPTLNYFNQLLTNIHNDSLMILDDIHWSAQMEQAWNQIIAHPKVTVSIDTYKWGLLFFRKEQVKQHFIIRSQDKHY